MDRMDCQLLMLCFSSFHYRTFIFRKVPSMQKMLFLFSLMPPAEKRQLYDMVSKHE